MLATSNIFCRNYFFYGFLCVFATCFSEARYELERLLNHTKWLKLCYKWIRMYRLKQCFLNWKSLGRDISFDSQRWSQWSSVASPSVQKNHVAGVWCGRGRIALAIVAAINEHQNQIANKSNKRAPNHITESINNSRLEPFRIRHYLCFYYVSPIPSHAIRIKQ